MLYYELLCCAVLCFNNRYNSAVLGCGRRRGTRGRVPPTEEDAWSKAGAYVNHYTLTDTDTDTDTNATAESNAPGIKE